VEIARVEHVRGDPKALDRFLGRDVDAGTRRRALVALGRIGDREGVAPRVRDALRRGGGDAPTALFAAGLTRAKELVPDVLAYLDLDPTAERDLVTAAIEAVGYLADARANGFVRPFLEAKAAEHRAAACLALWRLGDERDLKAVVESLEDDDPQVRRAAAAASWRLAALRRTARSKKDAPWEGSPELAELVAAHVKAPTGDVEAETVLFAARALNALLPKTLRRVDPETKAARVDARLLDGLAVLSDHALADVAFRLGGTHDGDDLVDALASALSRESAIAREAVVDALGKLGTERAAKALLDRVPLEKDPRTRRALGVALAACGDDAGSVALLKDDEGRAGESARAAALLASKKPEQVAAAVALARSPKTSRFVRAELLDGLAKKDHEDLAALGREYLDDPDFVVRATAATLLGKKGGAAAIADLERAYRPDAPREDNDRRQAIVEALGDLAIDKGVPAAEAKRAAEVVERALADPAPTVRLAAREAAKDIPALAKRAEAEDPRPNDWKGLPRPKKPLFHLDLTKGGPWLSEEEILLLAGEIRRHEAQVVFDTERGTIRVAPDAGRAPVHAANLVLCALAGVYDGTTWHRMVPAFVIQGGDPHGDGSGDAGYALPDEITRLPFERGAFGMPKGTKDTGGCQVFAMHVAAPHLDRNYTCFGKVVEGQDVVDAIRVGDRIRTARVETASPARR
jgi:peptidyl-prolyl cis-trans isomerase B (cyclophilin B)